MGYVAQGLEASGSYKINNQNTISMWCSLIRNTMVLSRFSAYLFSLRESSLYNGPSLQHGKSSEKDAIVLTKQPAHFRSDFFNYCWVSTLVSAESSCCGAKEQSSMQLLFDLWVLLTK